jgi:hypothetical protein
MTNSFKPFFIHHNQNVAVKTLTAAERQLRRGFTAKVEPGSTPRTVKVAVTFCSMRDEFIKKQGRAVVEALPREEINVRHLPAWLLEQEGQCLWPCGSWNEGKYNHVLKYVV